MELRIINPTEDGFIKAIEWNHEEIKKEVSEKVEYYKNLVYTDDQIKDAKADRATLRKFIEALETKRKEIKNQCLAPYEAFEKQMKEITAIVNEPVALIDKQVKEYEEKQKHEKAAKIDELLKEAEKELPDEMHISYDSKWLNASVSMKSIQEAINAKVEQVKKDLDTLSNLPEFGFEATEVYKSTLDVNKAINEAKRMSDIAKTKAAHEAEMKARADEQARLAAELEAQKIHEEAKFATGGVVAGTVTAEAIVGEIPVEIPAKQWISFSALLSVEDATALKDFFNNRSIEFKAV